MWVEAPHRGCFCKRFCTFAFHSLVLEEARTFEGLGR